MSVIPNKVDVVIGNLIEREGDYVDHPDDPGGATRWGITERVARRSGYDGDMRELPREKAHAIYLRQYYTGPRFDDVAVLSPAIAEELFDTGVNMGQGDAAQFLQRALNALNRQQRLYPDLVVDGYIGDKTLDAFEAYLGARPDNGEAVMLKALDCLQGAEYIELAEGNPDLESFVFGWLRTRIGSLGHG